MNDMGKLDLLMGVMNLLPSPLYIKDSNHVWVEANSAFCDFVGIPRDKLIGHTDHDYFPSEQADVFWEMDNKVLETREPNINIEKNSSRSGVVRWVESTKSFYQDSDGNAFIIGVLTDITVLKTREKALEEAEQAALRASQSKSEFLANMSHEIRTPMNGVLGMSQILRRTPLTEDQTDIVNTIERSGEALLTIINDILDFSKIEAGKFEVDAAPFTLAAIVDDVAALLATGASEKGIELICNVATHLPARLIGDSGRIRQVLTNLVGNALKFTAKGYVLVMVDGTVVDGQAELVISVEDTGIGIAADKLDTIFRQFEQEDSSTTRRFGGTGLGLTISRNLIEAMGGCINVSSTPGKGSVFTIHLALPVDETAAGASVPAPVNHDLSQLRVLVLDDIALNCRIAKTQLEQFGAAVNCATTAKSALKKLVDANNSGEPYHMLLIDYQMPDMDGLELTRMIRKYPAFAPLKIIALSSVDAQEVKACFLMAGISEFLVKPLRCGALVRSVATAFALPVTPVPVVAAAPAPRRAPVEPQPAGPRILVAEDNETNQRVMKGLLAEYECSLEFAPNGQVALDLYKSRTFDLVLMDVSMPVMDGLAATQAIRAHESASGSKQTPIVAVTAHALNSEHETFRAKGMDDVLCKPVSYDGLIGMIEIWTGAGKRRAA